MAANQRRPDVGCQMPSEASEYYFVKFLGVAHTSCFLRCMRAVRTHVKLRHVCATQSIATRLNIVKLAIRASRWWGARSEALYRVSQPRCGRLYGHGIRRVSSCSLPTFLSEMAGDAFWALLWQPCRFQELSRSCFPPLWPDPFPSGLLRLTHGWYPPVEVVQR